MSAKDLARKIDAYRNLAEYVLLTPKEAKRVAIELRRAARLAKKVDRYESKKGWTTYELKRSGDFPVFLHSNSPKGVDIEMMLPLVKIK